MATYGSDMIVGIGIQTEYGAPSEAMHYARVPDYVPDMPFSLAVDDTPEDSGLRMPGTVKREIGGMQHIEMIVPYSPLMGRWWDVPAHRDEEGQNPYVTVEMYYPRQVGKRSAGFRWHSTKLGQRALEVSPGLPALLHIHFAGREYEEIARMYDERSITEQLGYANDEMTLVMHSPLGNEVPLPFNYLRIGQVSVLKETNPRKPMMDTPLSYWGIKFVTSEIDSELLDHHIRGEKVGLEVLCKRDSASSRIALPQAGISVCSLHTGGEKNASYMIVEASGVEDKKRGIPAGTWE